MDSKPTLILDKQPLGNWTGRQAGYVHVEITLSGDRVYQVTSTAPHQRRPSKAMMERTNPWSVSPTIQHLGGQDRIVVLCSRPAYQGRGASPYVHYQFLQFQDALHLLLIIL